MKWDNIIVSVCSAKEQFVKRVLFDPKRKMEGGEVLNQETQ